MSRKPITGHESFEFLPGVGRSEATLLTLSFESKPNDDFLDEGRLSIEKVSCSVYSCFFGMQLLSLLSNAPGKEILHQKVGETKDPLQ